MNLKKGPKICRFSNSSTYSVRFACWEANSQASRLANRHWQTDVDGLRLVVGMSFAESPSDEKV